MHHIRRFAPPIAGLAATALLIAGLNAPSAAADPPLTVSSHSIAQGASLTVGGSGCSAADAGVTTVQVDLVNAFGDGGTIHTQDVASGHATPDPSGNWSISIHVAAAAQSGAYDLLATCLKGATPATWAPLFNYSNGAVTVGSPAPSTTPSTPTTTTTTAAPAPEPTMTSAPVAPVAPVATVVPAKTTTAPAAGGTTTPPDAVDADTPTANPDAATSSVAGTSTVSAAGGVDADAISSVSPSRTALAGARASHNGGGPSAMLIVAIALAIVAVAAAGGRLLWRRRTHRTG